MPKGDMAKERKRLKSAMGKLKTLNEKLAEAEKAKAKLERKGLDKKAFAKHLKELNGALDAAKKAKFDSVGDLFPDKMYGRALSSWFSDFEHLDILLEQALDRMTDMEWEEVNRKIEAVKKAKKKLEKKLSDRLEKAKKGRQGE